MQTIRKEFYKEKGLQSGIYMRQEDKCQFEAENITITESINNVCGWTDGGNKILESNERPDWK